jgi:D-serine deaminase-like pyridoxal phosphate-dependent protein
MTDARYEYLGMPREEIDTPVLLVDLEVLEANIAKLARHFREAGKHLRPHTKSHKTPAIARKQLEAGAIGITCAKLGEAEAMADAGIRDILVANEVVGPRKIARLMDLARRAEIMVAVDNPGNLAQLEEAAGRAGVRPRILIEINIGHNRCGVEAGTPAAVELAKAAARCRHLRFFGLMGYEGHVVDLEDREAREGGARECLQRLVDTRAAVEREGIAVEICSASGTGDYYLSTTYTGVTEVQAGSYALMDAAYGKLGLGFGYAMTVLTTVVSRPAPDRVITDAGLKALTPEHGMPLVKDHPELECHALSEEHGRLRTAAGTSDIPVGAVLEFIPGHGCTTVNLYDQLYAIRAGRLEAIWPVAGRGKAR